MTEFHQTMKSYFGGMSPIVPVAATASMVAIAAVSSNSGINAFGTFLVAGWLLLVGYSVVVTLRNPSRRNDVARLVVLPGSVGLLLATLIGFTGLTVSGLGGAWSTSSLFLGALVTAGAFAFTRMLLDARHDPS